MNGYGNVNTVISLTRSKNERGESPGSPGVVRTFPQNHEILPRRLGKHETPRLDDSGFLIISSKPALTSAGTGEQRTHAWFDDRKRRYLHDTPKNCHPERSEGSSIAGESFTWYF